MNQVTDDTPSDPADLLLLELDTLWRRDDRGRLTGTRTPDHRPPPLLALTTDGHSLVWATAAVVPDAVHAAIADVLAATTAATGLGWTPESAPDLLDLLAPLGVVRAEGGPAYLVPEPVPVPALAAGVELLTGGDQDLDRVRGRMPEDDWWTLEGPWAVAILEDEVAAVCETSRSTPVAVEAGLWTDESHRRRGLGSAVTAAWTHLVAGRRTFYSTGRDNHASQGVARTLGFRLLSQWWQVHALQGGV